MARRELPNRPVRGNSSTDTKQTKDIHRPTQARPVGEIDKQYDAARKAGRANDCP